MIMMKATQGKDYGDIDEMLYVDEVENPNLDFLLKNNKKLQ